MNTPPPSRTLLLLAFATIYLVWGSTYLAIRVAVETLPPFLSAGVRFVVAGILMFGLLAALRVPRPHRQEWRSALITGSLLCVGGNGLVMWAERGISSSLTALIIALTPIWFALLDWVRPNGVRPRPKTVVGILVGFAGVTLLILGQNGNTAHSFQGWSVVALIFAGILWAGGSLYTKHSAPTRSPWMQCAAQMICGGAGLLVLGLCAGEPWRTEWSRISERSLLALGYLIVFGSWIGFSAYVWLLRVTTPSLVSTYAYVNPVIAVFLGRTVLGEDLGPRAWSGAIVILLGVMAITIPESALATAWTRIRRGSKPEPCR